MAEMTPDGQAVDTRLFSPLTWLGNKAIYVLRLLNIDVAIVHISVWLLYSCATVIPLSHTCTCSYCVLVSTSEWGYNPSL